MKRYTCLVAALLVSVSCVSTTHAQLYWDSNADAGAGGTGSATPDGIWDTGTTAFWNANSDGTGAPGFWTDNSDAVFSAGTDATGAYTATLSGTVLANSLSFEEGAVTISGGTELDLTGAGNIAVASPASGQIDSIVGGSTPITKLGDGTLNLTAANTFNGGFTLSSGTVRVNNNTALGAVDSPVAIGDGTTLSATAGTARTLTYAFSTNGNFTLGQASGGTGALTLAGTMDVGGSQRTITVNNSSDTISAVVGGINGGIVKEGTGTLTLSGASTYTGPTTVNAGILSVTNATGLGVGTTTNSTNTTITDGATLQVSGGITINERIVVNGNGSTGSNGAIRKTGNNTTVLHGQLTGTGSIMVTTGTLRFTQSTADGSNTGFSGPITATGGGTIRFELIVPNQLGQNNVLTLDNGILRNDNSVAPGNGSMFSSTQTMTLGAGGGTLEYNTAGGLSIVNGTSVISGPGGLTKTGVGTVTIASASTYGGPTHVVAGTLRVRTDNERYPNGSALTIDSGATFDVDGLTETMGSLAGAGTLEINGGSFLAGGDNTSTSFTGLITGSGTGTNLTKQGTGTLTINGTNTYTGNTTISGGAIRVQTNAALGTSAGLTTVSSGAALEIDGSGLALAEPLTISSTGLTAAPNTGGLRNIANDNTVSGDIKLNGAARIQSDSGTLSLTGPGIQASTTTGRALTVGGAGNVTISNVIGDLAGANNVTTFTKADAGTVTLSGANVYTSTTTISAGTLNLGASGVIPDGSAVSVTGTLEMNGFDETIGSLAGAGNVNMPGNLTTGGAVALTSTAHSGVISGAGSLTKIGIGTQSLSGANSYSLGTTVSGGRLHANNATATGSGAVLVNNGAVLAGTGHIVGAATVASSGHLGGGTGVGDGTSLTADSTVDVQAGGHLDFVMGAPGTLAGDYNNDLIVDAADYVIWRKDPANHGSDPGGYIAWRGNYGGTGTGVGTADRLKVTTAGGLTLAAGSILTLLGGTTAPSGAYTVLEYNTNYNGTFSSLLINNSTGFELGSIVDNTTAKTFDVNITSTVQDRTWVGVGNGNWSANQLADGANWDDGSQPNGPGAIGRFLATGGGNPAHVVTITDSDKTLGNMFLDNTSSYTIAATGPHRFITNTYSGNAAINVLNGNHTISAPMTVSKTTDVTVTNGANTLTISGNVANNTGLIKAGAGNLIISGVMSGTGSFQTTAGTTTLSAANTYTGLTTVGATSTLTLTNTGTTSGTGTGNVTVNGTLNNNGRNTGTTTINSGGIENIAGTATGAHTISGGTLSINAGGVHSGTSTINTGGVENNSGTASGTHTINAGGVENIIGSASGTHTVTGGTVNVTGTLTATATVNTNGTITGTGTAAGITLNNTGGGGHLQPGGIAAAGSMTATGTVTFGNGSIFNIDVLSPGNDGVTSDLLNMTSTAATTGGLVITSGATIVVNDLSNGANNINGTYKFLDYASTSNANVANWTSITGPAGHSYTLQHDTGNTLINLLIAPAGSGSGLEGGAVPEPATVGIVAIGFVALAFRRRGKR